MNTHKAIFCWSGGKDSSLALHRVLKDASFQVVALLTTLNQTHRRISMHGTREELLDQQAAAIGLPLTKVWVSEGSNDEYERKMEEELTRFKNEGVTHVIFGDIFLEDLRTYRENNLSKVGLKAHFPLWKEDTHELINEFWRSGFETITCCVSTKYLNKNFVGRKVDSSFITELPTGVDVCGENGEFHTFCYKGPIFKQPVSFTLKEKVFKPITEYGMEGKDGFWFIDLVPE